MTDAKVIAHLIRWIDYRKRGGRDMHPDRCPVQVYLVRAHSNEIVGIVQCAYSRGHSADGSNAFAFHTARRGQTVVAWVDGRVAVDLPAEEG